VARLRLKADLRTGLDNEALAVHYQPIVELATGRLAGFEALVRWHHPARGVLGPIDFLDVAESTGMIVPIGRRVLTEACERMVEWQQRFGELAPAAISVNVSSRQFADADFAGEVEAILHETGLPPSSL